MFDNCDHVRRIGIAVEALVHPWILKCDIFLLYFFEKKVVLLVSRG